MDSQALALIVITALDFIRKPIRNADGIATRLDVPVLVSPDNQNDPGLLFANIKLTVGDEASNISLASVCDPSASMAVFNKVEDQKDTNNIAFTNVGTLTKSGDAVANVAVSNGVVLCMREWKDTLNELEDALNELAIANARIIGIAVLG